MYFPKIKEGFKAIEHRELKGEVKHCTVLKTPTGKFFSERIWTCPNGHTLDWDINARKNILEEGLRIIGAELSDNTGRALNKTSEKKHKALKSEAHLSLVNG